MSNNQTEQIADSVKEVQVVFGEFFAHLGFSLTSQAIDKIVFDNPQFKLEFHYANRYTHQFEGIFVFPQGEDEGCNYLDVLEFISKENSFERLQKLSENGIVGLKAYLTMTDERVTQFFGDDNPKTLGQLKAFLKMKNPW